MKYLLDVRCCLKALLLVLGMAPVVSAMAVVVEVSGRFRATDFSSGNTFSDTTRTTACRGSTVVCESVLSRLALSGMWYSSAGILPPNTEVGIRLPTADRTVLLVHDGDGVTTSELLFRIDGVGGGIPRDSASSSNWNGRSFSAGVTSCTGYPGLSGSSLLMFFWGADSTSTCTITNSTRIESLSIEQLFLSYRMTPPRNPLAMKPGTYRGSLRYSVGAGTGDIAFFPSGGRVFDNVVVINFTLEVPLIFRVDIPAGGEKIELTPEEGWANWLLRGRNLSRLVKNQTFNLWSNSPLTMKLECSHQVGDSCALQENGGSLTVPVNVSVSLPGTFTDRSNARVNNKLLRVSGMGADSIRPSSYIERQPGNLQFEVRKEAVSEMLMRLGSSYGGTVTVVWESSIN